MQNPKKFRPEAEQPPMPPSDMEKDIASLKSLRKLRLAKKERDYSQKKKVLNQAEETLNEQMNKIRNLQASTKQEKKRLHQINISRSSQPHELLQWIEYEQSLDDAIQKSIQDLIPFQRKVESASNEEKKSKAILRQAQLSIEKLEILEEEIKKETA